MSLYKRKNPQQKETNVKNNVATTISTNQPVKGVVTNNLTTDQSFNNNLSVHQPQIQQQQHQQQQQQRIQPITQQNSTYMQSNQASSSIMTTSTTSKLPSFDEIRKNDMQKKIILISYYALNDLKQLFKHIDPSIVLFHLSADYLKYTKNDQSVGTTNANSFLINHRCFFDLQLSQRVSCVIFQYTNYRDNPKQLTIRLKTFIGVNSTIKLLFIYIDEKSRSLPSIGQHLNELNLLCASNNIQLILTFAWYELARYIEAFTLLEHYTQCGTLHMEVYDCVRNNHSTLKTINLSTALQTSMIVGGNPLIDNGKSQTISFSFTQKAAHDALHVLPGFSTQTIVSIFAHFNSMRDFGHADGEKFESISGIGGVRRDSILQILNYSFDDVLKKKFPQSSSSSSLGRSTIIANKNDNISDKNDEIPTNNSNDPNFLSLFSQH